MTVVSSYSFRVAVDAVILTDRQPLVAHFSLGQKKMIVMIDDYLILSMFDRISLDGG